MEKLRKKHPRPQFIRKNWASLDGEWDFSFDDENTGLKNSWQNGFTEARKINVPFTYETKLSGIEDTSHHAIVWYQKKKSLA